ncbi:MAG: RNA polymerase sigma factor [Firmicutes bacterium]|nr:RNA polymerase sigma factor [Bacillota bacterium]
MRESDEILYDRFLKEGRENDLRILLERHREGLTLFLYGYVHSMEDAEELMLDAFAAAAAGTTRFSGKSSFKTWLFAIGRNQALNHLRRRKITFTTLEDDLTGDAGHADLEMLRKERDRQLYEALEQLNPDYRQVLYLLYFEDMSHEDAGRVMKKNRKQIYNLAARGKKALKEILEGMGFDNA